MAGSEARDVRLSDAMTDGVPRVPPQNQQHTKSALGVRCAWQMNPAFAVFAEQAARSWILLAGSGACRMNISDGPVTLLV